MQNFTVGFHQLHKPAKGKKFRSAVFEALQVCNSRGKRDMQEELELVNWAYTGFLQQDNDRPHDFEPSSDEPIPPPVLAQLAKFRNQTSSDESQKGSECEDMHPPEPKTFKILEQLVKEVQDGHSDILDVCLSCGSRQSIVAQHPMFHGGLCHTCPATNNEPWLFEFGEDGSCIV
jgi:hypothetical protein